MSHGIRRVKISPEAERLKQEREQKLIDEYRRLADAVLTRRQAHDYGPDALALTTRVLRKNPEFYSAWNYRREILLDQFRMFDEPAITTACQSELDFFMETIHYNPKCYWIWNHRMWVLKTIPRPDWDMELKLVGRMLDLDARNFHGWNYRSYITDNRCALASTPEEALRVHQQEFDYTTTKIHQNFSNRSAWHNRTVRLPIVYKAASLEQRATLLATEYELVQNAIFTEPNDQCAWLYLRWLLEFDMSNLTSSTDKLVLLEREQHTIQELLDLEPDSQWAIQCLVHLLQMKQRLGDLSETDTQCITKATEQLINLDAMRAERYKDWSHSLNCV
ncbi:Rab geranylgeranyltransferase [Dimargaris xerosporica]|nr:Rab geranylgeranyltransferase [Dimargaris xerosporica]